MQQLSRKIAFIGNQELSTDKHYMPEWKCFCCHDTGFVTYSLIRLVIPEYNADGKNREELPVCNRCGAKSSIPYAYNDILDHRFTQETCEELHQFSIQDWQQSIERLNSQIQSAKLDSRGEVVTNSPQIKEFLEKF